ncbi:class I SAM-dependent methyltransferase [Micromonospora sp. NPDC023956]|uniref:class I SAM-dependent methyltransferase n=1 Tax=Micromonospora sp. NPDC023956 TaxID=3155722 RepID=UPI0033ED523F
MPRLPGWPLRALRHRRALPERQRYLRPSGADLAPGTALDAGCGEGADARWLASRGWRVTAVDLAATALRRAREQAAELGADVAGRIHWVRADLTTWTPPGDGFDLVCAHYVHSTAPPGTLLRRLAASVAPDGTLLVVGHHPSDPHHPGGPPRAAEAQVTAEEMVDSLGPGWDVLVAGTRTRPAGPGPHGPAGTARDAVLRARRRP